VQLEVLCVWGACLWPLCGCAVYYCGLALPVVPVVRAPVVCLSPAGGGLSASNVGPTSALTWVVSRTPSPVQA